MNPGDLVARWEREGKVVGGKGRSGNLAGGLVFLVVSLSFVFFAILGFRQGDAGVGNPSAQIFSALGGLFTFLALLMCSYRNEAVFDLGKRQITVLQGFRPFAQPVARDFSDLDAVAIRHRREQQGQHGPTVDVWLIEIVFRKPSGRTDHVARWVGDAYLQARDAGERLADKLGVELKDQTGQKMVKLSLGQGPRTPVQQSKNAVGRLVPMSGRSLLLPGLAGPQGNGPIVAGVAVLLASGGAIALMFFTLAYAHLPTPPTMIALYTVFPLAMGMIIFFAVLAKNRKDAGLLGREQLLTLDPDLVKIEFIGVNQQTRVECVAITPSMTLTAEAPTANNRWHRLCLANQAQTIRFGEALTPDERDYVMKWLESGLAAKP
jgi:hypothetical protein